MAERAWLVERADDGTAPPTYLSGREAWSHDHMDAIRFARKEDAMKAADGHRVCEHIWDEGPAPKKEGYGTVSARKIGEAMGFGDNALRRRVRATF